MTYICVGNKILAGDHKVRALSIEHDLSGLEFMQPYWPSAVNMIPRLHQTRQVSRHTLLRSSIFLGFRREGPPSIRSYKHYQVIKVLNWLDWTFTRKSCQSSHSSSLSHLSSSFASQTHPCLIWTIPIVESEFWMKNYHPVTDERSPIWNTLQAI